MELVGTVHQFEHSSTGYIIIVGEEGDIGQPKIRPSYSERDWQKPIIVYDYSPETETKLGEAYRVSYEELGLCSNTPTADD